MLQSLAATTFESQLGVGSSRGVSHLVLHPLTLLPDNALQLDVGLCFLRQQLAAAALQCQFAAHYSASIVKTLLHAASIPGVRDRSNLNCYITLTVDVWTQHLPYSEI